MLRYFFCYRFFLAVEYFITLKSTILGYFQIVRQFYRKPTGKTGGFAPALINSVHGIAPDDHMSPGIIFHPSFTLIGVGVDHDMARAVGIVCESEDSGPESPVSSAVIPSSGRYTE